MTVGAASVLTIDAAQNAIRQTATADDNRQDTMMTIFQDELRFTLTSEVKLTEYVSWS